MARTSERNGTLRCSFCGKSQNDVRKLIAGPTVYICDECIELCNDQDQVSRRKTQAPGRSPGR